VSLGIVTWRGVSVVVENVKLSQSVGQSVSQSVFVSADSELSFDVQPTNTVAYVGQPAILHCLVNSRLHPAHVYWIKDGSSIQLDSRRSYLLCIRSK